MRDKNARDRSRNDRLQPREKSRPSTCPSPISPPSVTRITIPNSPLTADRPPVVEDNYDEPLTSTSSSSPEQSREEEPSYEDPATPPPVDEDALDELWRNIRHKKEKRMTKDKCKVDSLKARDSPAPPGTFIEDPQSIEVPPPRESRRKHTSSESARDKPHTMRRQKSVTSFIQSPDGRTIVASFNMRGVPRENIHVSFHGHRLVVTWVTIEVAEWVDEEGRIIRERTEKNFQRSLPLPEGTRVDEITCAMSGKYLLTRFPNSRSFRVEAVSEERR